MNGLISYRLEISLAAPVRVKVGKLGEFDFPAGRYLYTGSAKRNLEARIARHLHHDKRLHWHIDYLLMPPGVAVTGVERFAQTECAVNCLADGRVLVAGFGASDCRAGCVSHLKFVG